MKATVDQLTALGIPKDLIQEALEKGALILLVPAISGGAEAVRVLNVIALRTGIDQERAAEELSKQVSIDIEPEAVYAFIFAHELAHFLKIHDELEADFFACRRLGYRRRWKVTVPYPP